MRRIHILLFVFILNSGIESQAQVNGISVQGEIVGITSSTLSLSCVLISVDGDTIWHESHSSISVSTAGTYSFILGAGLWQNGAATSFDTINWLVVDRVDIHRTDLLPSYLLSSLNIAALPYAYHSKHITDIPNIINMFDYEEDILETGYLLKFDGTLYSASIDIQADTCVHAHTSDHSDYADTAEVAIMDYDIVDSSLFAFTADSTLYAYTASESEYSDTASIATYADTVLFALNNWSHTGNEGLDDSHFVGSVTGSDVAFRTNFQQRLVLADDHKIFNTIPYAGFGITSTQGAIFPTNGLTGVT